jgi:hypothetical protein
MLFLVEMISNLEANQVIFRGEDVVAFYTDENQEEVDFDSYEIIEYEDCITVMHTLFLKNDAAIREDFEF